MWFPSYGSFVASMGYSPASSSAIDTGNSIWWRTKNGNVSRFSDDSSVGVTVCRSKKDGTIGYMWNIGEKKGWKGPFGSVEAAMADADSNVFGS